MKPTTHCAAILGSLMGVFAGFAILFGVLGKRDMISPILRRYCKPFVVAFIGVLLADLVIKLIEGLRTGNFGPSISLLVLGLIVWHFCARLFEDRTPSPGSVYPKLQLLVDKQLVTILNDGKSRRKTNAIDAVGRKELAEKDAEVRALFDRPGDLAADTGSVLDRQIDSALDDLTKAVALCRSDGSRSDDKMERVHALVLDAAHRIERL